MNNSAILTISALGLILFSCQGENKPSSGKSAYLVEAEKEPETEKDNSNKNASVIDSNSAEILFEAGREKVEQNADAALTERPEKEVRISGTIIGGAGMDITLDKLGGKTNVEPIKTTIINEDGYFELDATTKQEQIFSLRTDSGNMILFLDEGNYEIRANASELSKYQVNAPMSYKVRDFYLILEEFNEQNRKISKREDRYTKAKQAWKVKRILDSMPIYNARIEKDRAAAIKNFINNNRNSPFAAEAANRLDFLKHTAFVEELYDELVEKFPYSSYVKNTGLKLVEYRPMAIGKEAPDLVMPEIDGTNYRLSSLEGEHVLLLFSSSFSDPSINYAKDLVSVYNKYSSKGFKVYNVVLEETQENWQRYLDQTGANWIVVSDMLGQTTTAFDFYMAFDLPMTYMINSEGKIAAKFLSVKEVDEYLSENI